MQNHLNGASPAEPWLTTFNFYNPMSLNGENSTEVLEYVKGVFRQMVSKFIDHPSDHVRIHPYLRRASLLNL